MQKSVDCRDKKMTIKQEPNHCLVIATRNRNEDLEHLLESVRLQTFKPNCIYLVDSSKEEVFAHNEESIRKIGIPFIHIPSMSGISHQKNIGFGFGVNHEFMHVIDDDVRLDPLYFEKVLKYLSESQNCIAVGGKNESTSDKQPHLVRRILRLATSKGGSVLMNGINEPARGDESLQVHWLSGCAVTWKTSICREIRFEQLHWIYPDSWLPGDDVEISLWANKFGKLIYLPSARYFHDHSTIERDNSERVGRKIVAFRFHLCRTPYASINRIAVIIGILSQAFLSFLKWIKFHKSNEKEFALGLIIGLIQQPFLNTLRKREIERNRVNQK